VLLLHGLAGHGGEWAETASWLTESFRVLAPDARGHGRSERVPLDVSRAAHVAEASPAAGDESEVAAVGKALASWPVPFPSREAAAKFFGGPSLRADAWADGLEQRDGGWWPGFEVEVMVRTLREAVERSHWSEWESVRCPVLVMRAGDGTIPAADARAMVDRLRQARLVELACAGHDLHLDRPAEWRDALSRFLDSLGA
jgi:pimeloyl-ACP methyl ester carboxylesterase